MIDLANPIYQVEYQARSISIFIWGEERKFFAQINNEYGYPVGSAPRLYDTADAAINVCKDLIDFLYGDVDCYRERPLPSYDFAGSTYIPRSNAQTARLPYMAG